MGCQWSTLYDLPSPPEDSTDSGRGPAPGNPAWSWGSYLHLSPCSSILRATAPARNWDYHSAATFYPQPQQPVVKEPVPPLGLQNMLQAPQPLPSLLLLNSQPCLPLLAEQSSPSHRGHFLWGSLARERSSQLSLGETTNVGGGLSQ